MNFDPLTCPSDGLEKSLKKLNPLIRNRNGLEEFLNKLLSGLRVIINFDQNRILVQTDSDCGELLCEAAEFLLTHQLSVFYPFQNDREQIIR